jgi:26S proteasome regulatory subunit N5
LQDVHVETYGSLSKKEKVEFILEQMRLTLANKDYVRAAIVSSKISRKHLQEESMEHYKVTFYMHMCEYHRSQRDAFELAKDYHAIYVTPHVLADEAKWKGALRSAVAFLALSPHGNEQQDTLHRVSLDPNLDKLDDCRYVGVRDKHDSPWLVVARLLLTRQPLSSSSSDSATIQLFLKNEIISYPLVNQAAFEAIPALREGGDALAQHWKDALRRRTVQHNLRVVGRYYTRIRGARLARLLRLPGDRLEAELADMVSSGTLYAKIDRPNDVVRFCAPQPPEAVLSDWASDLDTLLHLVETTTHLIHKENMTSP